MAILKSDAYCVWYWQTFKEMSWPSKLMEATFLLQPLCATPVAFLYKEHDFLEAFWIAAVALLWLSCADTLLYYVRGRYAQRRGVRPEPPPAKPSLKLPLSNFISLWDLVLFGGTAWLCVFHKQNEVITLMFLLLFFQRLSAYPRANLRDKAPDLNDLTPGRQTPASPLPPSPSRPA